MLSCARHSGVLLLMVWTMVLSRGAAGQFSDSGRDGTMGCGELRLLIREKSGRPVAGASVWINGNVAAVSGSSGEAEAPVAAANGQPISIRVTANGYKPQQELLWPDDCNPMVNLERDAAENLSPTISARELRPDIQKKSEELQLRAAKAREQADYDASLRLLLEALQLTPSDPAICNNLGFSFVRKGDLDHAGVWFERALKLAPSDALITGNLGLIRWAQGNHEAARPLLTKAVEHGFSGAAAHYLLGLAALEKSLFVEAVRELSTVKRKQFPYRDLFLAIALRGAGKDADAAREYKRFIRNNRASLLMQRSAGGLLARVEDASAARGSVPSLHQRQ